MLIVDIVGNDEIEEAGDEYRHFRSLCLKTERESGHETSTKADSVNHNSWLLEQLWAAPASR
jgi:hypothetical protein